MSPVAGAERPTAGREFDWSSTRQFDWWRVLLAFAIPSAIAFTGFHVVLPALVAAGLPKLLAWSLVAAVMLAGLVVAGVALCAREAAALGIGTPRRLLLGRLAPRQWVFAIAALIAALLVAGLVQPLAVYLLQAMGGIPEYLPFWLDPSVNPEQTDAAVLSPGMPLAGNYAFLALIGVTLLLNVLAEEFYFRAWLLPKMQRFGALAWVFNGALFALYHTFQLWLLPVLLVVSLASAFVVQRTRSVWPALVVHLVANFLVSVAAIALLTIGG